MEARSLGDQTLTTYHISQSSDGFFQRAKCPLFIFFNWPDCGLFHIETPRSVCYSTLPFSASHKEIKG